MKKLTVAALLALFSGVAAADDAGRDIIWGQTSASADHSSPFEFVSTTNQDGSSDVLYGGAEVRSSDSEPARFADNRDSDTDLIRNG